MSQKKPVMTIKNGVNLMKKVKHTQPLPSNDETDETAIQQKIRERAYFNWINRGCVHGDELNDWMDAEQQVMDSLRAKRT
jgi:hypothetical protein